LAIAFIFTLIALIVIFGVYFGKQNKINKSRELIRLYGKLAEINERSTQNENVQSSIESEKQQAYIKSRIEQITGVQPDSTSLAKGRDPKSRDYAKECEESILRLLRGSSRAEDII
jgi:hypothetical protein